MGLDLKNKIMTCQIKIDLSINRIQGVWKVLKRLDSVGTQNSEEKGDTILTNL